MNDHTPHDHSLAADLSALLSRRRALGLLGSASALSLVGCGPPPMGRTEPDVTALAADGHECVADPEETEGPFPADGSNRAHWTLANVLTDSGIVRSDMRLNLAGTGAPADGQAMRLKMTLVNVGQSCDPLANYALYVWHCDAEGRYSIYQTDTTYLRAVGVTDATGSVEFLTIVPGCYDGRHPHIHFEVYPSLSTATSTKNRLLTSQLVVPTSVCRAAYDALPIYARSRQPLASSPLEKDMIFADNTAKQLAAQTLDISQASDGILDASVRIGLKRAA